MYRRLIDNPILANLVFLLVLALGLTAYLTMPRQQDPSVNFNWVEIHTRFPGASAVEVEERVTEILEQGLQGLSDVRFSMSESRPGVSRIVVRFHTLSEDELDSRITELRREVQNETGRLPDGARSPEILEINSDNQKPSVMLLAVGQAFDEHLRDQAERMADDIERFPSVDRVDRLGMRDPELQVRFDPASMQGLGISPTALADTVRAYFQDTAAGSLALGDQEWSVRLSGTRNDPAYLEGLPLVTARGEVPVRSVAQVSRGLDEPTELVRYKGRPAILLAVYKDEASNLLRLVERVREHAQSRTEVTRALGVRFLLLDDQTGATRHALSIMERNAAMGLVLLMSVTWLLLGWRMAVIASLGIPFSLAGALAVAALLGQTLNVVVLLGLVVSLGMLVDDAVVIAEAIYFRMQRGERALNAAVSAVREVGAAVLASVLTTIAAFLPLMLLPGILGDYMYLAPLIVTCALLFSLAEAFWILPGHVVAATPRGGGQGSWAARQRERATWWLRNRYSRLLIRACRRPWSVASGVLLLFVLAVGLLVGGLVRIDYFATDSARLFYVNVDMPAGTSLEKTLATTTAVEDAIRPLIKERELRAMASYAGLQIAKADTVMSDNAGQVAVSLRSGGSMERSVGEVIDAVRAAARGVPGPENVTFLEVRTGPPTEPAVKVKLRGDDLDRLTAAAGALQGILRQMPAVRNIRDDDSRGHKELILQLDADALVRSGLDPAVVTRNIRLLVDGAVVASMRDQGDTVNVRAEAVEGDGNRLDRLLGSVINLPGGGTTTLDELVAAQAMPVRGNIRHQNFRRAITVSADLDRERGDTLSVNNAIRQQWRSQLSARFPDVDLDFSGEMDDIKESLNSIGIYFLFGLMLVYLILGTQFRSYYQPLMVLVTVPTAFTGVVIGLAASGYALSLYTLYGAVALAGIAVNSAIVFVSSANERVRAGMPRYHATIFAARRRVVPILITTITTMAGLFSLAVGLAGASNVWGPVASAIVWGLGVSTCLSLVITPLLYARFAPVPVPRAAELPMPVPLERRRGAMAMARALLDGRLAERRCYRRDLQVIGSAPELARAYREGCRAMAASAYLSALKRFQQVADACPALALPNRAAAHAALAFMEAEGWDAGYEARVQRFLARALRQAPRAPDLLAVNRLYQDLRAQLKTREQDPGVPGYLGEG